MATVLSNEPEGEDEITERQMNYIKRLLETRRVSGLCAGFLIDKLEEQPLFNASGLENLKERIALPNT